MVVIISFSSRENGNCSQITKYIGSTTENKRLFYFSDFAIQPCGKCGYACFQHNDACPYYGDMEYTLLDTVCRSDRAVFVVPNYCDFPCANFFIYNERSQCYFQGHPERLEAYLNVPKRFIVVSGSESGNFAEAFQQHTGQEPEILFLSAKKYGKQSIGKDLLTSGQAVTDLAKFLGEQSKEI